MVLGIGFILWRLTLNLISKSLIITLMFMLLLHQGQCHYYSLEGLHLELDKMDTMSHLPALRMLSETSRCPYFMHQLCGALDNSVSQLSSMGG